MAEFALTAAAVDPRRVVGRYTLHALSHVGRFASFCLEMARSLSEWRIWLPRTLQQAEAIGYGSLFIVLLTAGFAGAVTALQTGYQFQANPPVYIVGGLIVQTIILELGPVLTALLLSGRIGARYAAELGTMRVTEQIDALESLGRSPTSHLIIPRVIAGTLMLPALVVGGYAIRAVYIDRLEKSGADLTLRPLSPGYLASKRRRGLDLRIGVARGNLLRGMKRALVVISRVK